MVATKAALSIRVDALTDADGKSEPSAPSIGVENRAKLESRLRALEHQLAGDTVRRFAGDAGKKQQRFDMKGETKTYNVAADQVDFVSTQREGTSTAAEVAAKVVSDVKEERKRAKEEKKAKKRAEKERQNQKSGETDEEHMEDSMDVDGESKEKKDKKRKRRESEGKASMPMDSDEPEAQSPPKVCIISVVIVSIVDPF